MKIAIGSDHRGFALKSFLINALPDYLWLDQGCFTLERTDYPEYATLVTTQMSAGHADRGILICGSGVGMAIAANRVKGIYAALCWNEEIARIACEHDGANILVLPADFVTHEQAVAITKVWLEARFLGGRYQERLEQIDCCSFRK